MIKKLPDKETLEKIWAEVPPDYYNKLNYGQKLWHEWKWLIIKHLITQNHKRPNKILEVGCSNGHLAGFIASLYPKASVVGIDVYEDAIKLARRSYPKIKFKIADAHRLPFRDNSFDLIVCSETIEHVLNPKKVLYEISRVMKKDGEALVEMDSGSPMFRFIWYFWTNFGKGRVWKYAHLHPFTARELENLISANGFLIKQKTLSHFGMAVSFLISKY